MRRPTGAGTIEKYGKVFRARLPDAKRSVLNVFPTHAEAELALDAWMATSRAPRGDSLATYGIDFMARRARTRPKSIDQDVDRWRIYVETWECFQWPLVEIRRGDVRRWVDGLHGRPLADQTVRNTLNLVRGCLQAALDDGVIASNPAYNLRIHARGSVEDVWDYLRPDEQLKLLRYPKMPEHLRAMMGFAIGTGLRWGEQRTLTLEDVHLDGAAPYVHVRRSAKGSTKNTRHRRVPLFGLGLAAATALVRLAKSRRNPRGLLCLPPRGEAYRSKNGPRLGKWLVRAEVKREIRWHDLRHTCGSSLVAGWWGHKWQLIEVRDLLGHRNISTTERYAHLAGSVVESAALETRRHDEAQNSTHLFESKELDHGFVNRRSGIQIPEVAPGVTEISRGASVAPSQLPNAERGLTGGERRRQVDPREGEGAAAGSGPRAQAGDRSASPPTAALASSTARTASPGCDGPTLSPAEGSLSRRLSPLLLQRAMHEVLGRRAAREAEP